ARKLWHLLPHRGQPRRALREGHYRIHRPARRRLSRPRRAYSPYPPVASTVCPVTHPASSLARNSTTVATSSGRPRRPIVGGDKPAKEVTKAEHARHGLHGALRRGVDRAVGTTATRRRGRERDDAPALRAE